MPDTMSVERRQLMKAYGAELVLTEGSKGMKGAIEKAAELAASLPNSFVPSQFDNPSNPKAHRAYRPRDLGGYRRSRGLLRGRRRHRRHDHRRRVVSEVQNPAVRVVAVEPAASPVLSAGTAGPHKIQGIGAGFVPCAGHRDL